MAPRWSGPDTSALLFLVYLVGQTLIAVVWYDVVLCRASLWGRAGTISAACLRWADRWPWLPWLVLRLFLLLWWHLFWDCFPFGSGAE